MASSHRIMDGKTVFITGGAGGIGFATAQAMLREGALAVMITDITDEIAEKAANRLMDAFPGRNIEYSAPKLTSEAEVGAVLKDFANKYGHLDATCAIAGITHNTTIKRIPDGEFSRQINVNLYGTYSVDRQAALIMREQGYGSIVNCSSITGLYGSPMGCGYGASKGAVISLTKSLSRELGPYNVRVNCVAPGSIKTPMTENLSDAAKQAAASGIALQRMGEASEVANVFLFLASDMSSYCTASVVNVDGFTV